MKITALSRRLWLAILRIYVNASVVCGVHFFPAPATAPLRQRNTITQSFHSLCSRAFEFGPIWCIINLNLANSTPQTTIRTAHQHYVV